MDSIKIFTLFLFLVLNFSCKDDDPVSDDETILNSVIDIDGNEYPIKKIGDQVWMITNLKTTKYNDGTPISHITDPDSWFNESEEGYSWYNNDPREVESNFGALYRWNTVNTGKLCPEGWHIPSLEEWTVLIDFAGGEAQAADKLKSQAGWELPNTQSTDEYGFNVLPAGFRYFDGEFLDREYESAFWTSTNFYEGNDYSDGSAWTITFRAHSSFARDFSRSVKMGYSCRCLQD